MTEEFDFFKFHLHGRYPNLVAYLKVDVEAAIDNLRVRIVDYGPVPVKLIKYDASRFTEPTFDWDVGSYGNPLADQELDEAVQWIDIHSFVSDATLANEDYERLQTELMPSAQQFLAARGFTLPAKHIARNTADDLYSDYHRYYGFIGLLEQSVVCERLRQLSADYMFERRNDRPLLVIPDRKIAAMIKLTYG